MKEEFGGDEGFTQVSLCLCLCLCLCRIIYTFIQIQVLSDLCISFPIMDDMDDSGRPLILNEAVQGSVDHRGRPSQRSESGGWRAAGMIIGVEIAERLAFFGISTNLVTYLTVEMGQSMATAAQNVNLWMGTASLLPLLAASFADSFLGRYLTILLASALYILGLALLTLSAMLASPNSFQGSASAATGGSSRPVLEVVLFFSALYLVAFAQGGHKPCVQAFGCDQFDGEHPQEYIAKCSFFNWWYFATTLGSFIALIILSYIQDNLGWGLGFGIPCISSVAALVVFLLGTRTYRFLTVANNKEKPFMRIGRVFVNAARNWRTTSSDVVILEEGQDAMLYQRAGQLRFLNKALVAPMDSDKDGKTCNIAEVEEAKGILRLIPIWIASLAYAIVLSQCSTFFVKQGSTMDRSITPNFQIPAATIQCFACIAVVLFVPIYDRLLVPTARILTLKPSGISMLQRIGVGMFISTLSMVVAALVELKRLSVAQEHGLTHDPNATIPIAIWWLTPQLLLLGVSSVFTMVGLQEFFYDQVSTELRSVGLALYLSIFGVGNLLSGVLVSAIEDATGGHGRSGWFANNINSAHLDYFYWLLAGIGEVGLLAFMYFANSYLYKYNIERSTV
ncbi:protein NRT1/ PTR FAMILY 5.10-like [Benincasa hispida]|uniref:protein NRT1/ PTR FAMILY 5.10-like n=1 Tax=Benincasa hispida TaxID=102211 RepID=UPI0019001147|nr:protein NRT1/ PTR FAMILY 5.10-like [Benincasa hispida]